MPPLTPIALSPLGVSGAVMSNSMLFIMRHSPYGSNLAREALEAVLAFGAFEQQVSVLFMDDGVFQLTCDHQPHAIQQKNHSSMLQALPMYDITNLYIEASSLSDRGLSELSLPNGSSIISSAEISQLINRHNKVLSF